MATKLVTAVASIVVCVILVATVMIPTVQDGKDLFNKDVDYTFSNVGDQIAEGSLTEEYTVDWDSALPGMVKVNGDTPTVYFVAGEGGTVSPTQKNVVTDLTYGTLPTPTRTGYTFDGWYTSTEYTTQITDTSIVVGTDDIILYAKWIGNTYTVTFDADGGTVSPATKTITFGQAYGTLPTPTYTGHIFGGWFDENDNPIVAQSVVSIADNHTLTAVWTLEQYLVSFTTDGNGTVDVAEVLVDYGTSYTISNNTITIDGTTVTATPNTGYVWDYWEPSTSGTVTGAMTFIAHFNNPPVTVSFTTDGNGTVSANSLSVPYETSYVIAGSTVVFNTSPATTVTATPNSDYTFSSWDQSSGTITTPITFTASFISAWVSKMPTDTTLNSYWTWDENGIGPFGCYYGAINLESGANADDSTEQRLSTDKGAVGYILNPSNLHQTLNGTTFTPTLYNVMVIIPTVYWGLDNSDPDNPIVMIASTPDAFDGFTLTAPAHTYTVDSNVDTGNNNMGLSAGTYVADYIAIGVYEAYNNNGVLTSMSGVMPTDNKSIDQYRALALAGNTSNTNGVYEQWNLFMYELIKLMSFTVMGNTDSQYMMGAGWTNASTNATTGTTSVAIQKSTGGTVAECLFIENGWGSLVDGIGDTYTSSLVVKAGNTLGGQTIEDLAVVDVTNGAFTLPSSAGRFINSLYLDGNGFGLPKIAYTSSVSTAGQGINDYCATSTGDKSIFIGGDRSNGNSAGISFWSNQSLNKYGAYWGSRLAYVLNDNSAPASIDSGDFKYRITFNSAGNIISNVETIDGWTAPTVELSPQINPLSPIHLDPLNPLMPHINPLNPVPMQFIDYTAITGFDTWQMGGEDWMLATVTVGVDQYALALYYAGLTEPLVWDEDVRMVFDTGTMTVENGGNTYTMTYKSLYFRGNGDYVLNTTGGYLKGDSQFLAYMTPTEDSGALVKGTLSDNTTVGIADGSITLGDAVITSSESGEYPGLFNMSSVSVQYDTDQTASASAIIMPKSVTVTVQQPDDMYGVLLDAVIIFVMVAILLAIVGMFVYTRS